MGDRTVCEGGCLCGAVRYRFIGAAPATNYCHCSNCRRATGGAVAAFADLAPGQFDWVSGEPMFYASSPGVRRGFCNACGTSLTYESDDQDGGVHVLSATLDLPVTHQPLAVFCKNERLPWLDVVLPST